MANLKETAQWEEGIYQIETSDPVMGGENGIDNKPLRQLANRTGWLKTELTKAVQSIGSNKTAADAAIALKADKIMQIAAGAGLTGGGNLTANRSIALATPSTLSGSTTNWVGNGATGHTHEIAKASPTVQGVMKVLNVLNSDDALAALSAAQGKALAEQIANTAQGSLKMRGELSGRDLNDIIGAANYGVWHNRTNAAAAAERNYPAAKAGTLLVLPSAYAGQQIYIPYDERVIYVRDTNNNTTTFGSWVAIGEVSNRLDDISATAALSAAQGKILNDTKLGNTGDQTLSGSLTATGLRVSDGDKTAGFARGESDIHIYNAVTKKSLQLKDNGDLAYSGDLVLLQSMLSSAVNSPSDTQIANSAAVKTAYDKAVAAETFAKRKADLSDFTVFKTENGYQKLPNGLILQWGQVQVSGDQYKPITFPVAFPAACVSAQATPIYEGGIGGNTVLSAHVGSISRTQLSVGVSENGAAAGQVCWFAVGY